MINLRAKILVPDPIMSKESGRQLLHLLLKYFPRHVPDRFGKSEPLKKHFDPQNLDAVLREWGNVSFAAGRADSTILFHILFCPSVTRNPHHSAISLLNFQSGQEDDANRMCEFVYEVSKAFGADCATVHILTRTELENRLAIIKQRPAVPLSVRLVGEQRQLFQASGEQTVGYLRTRIEREGFAPVLGGMVDGSFTVHLRKCLPDLSWLAVFGRPYLELFGREKVMATPAYEVREVSDALIGIRLTESLQDTSDDWEHFNSTRERCRVHLDCNSFCDPAMPRGHRYRVPEFRFPKVVYKNERSTHPKNPN